MTKYQLAKLIYDIVDNGSYVGYKQNDIIKAVKSILDLLQPKDIEKFAKWGKFDQRTSPSKCWR